MFNFNINILYIVSVNNGITEIELQTHEELTLFLTSFVEHVMW